MDRARSTALRIILPTAILVPLLFLHIGCIWVPWFEKRTDMSHKDFRGSIGSANSRRPIRPYAITRAQIQALLGQPQLISADKTATGYIVVTHGSYWVAPLCFAAEPANEKAYVVRFVFDPAGELIRYDVASDDVVLSPIASMEPWLAEGGAIQKLNRTGPKFRRFETGFEVLNGPPASRPVP